MRTTPQAGPGRGDDPRPRGAANGAAAPAGRSRRRPIPRTPAEPEVREFLHQLKLELTSLSTKAHVLANRADTIACMIQEIEANPAKVAAYAHAFAAGFTTAAHRAKADKAFRARAAAGIQHFSITNNPDGTCTAYLDNAPVHLPPKLALLLEILAAHTRPSTDAMVPWKQPKDITTLIQRITGKPFHLKSLNQLLCRLRTQLRLQAQLHRSCIQRHPDRGLRLALLALPPRPQR